MKIGDTVAIIRVTCLKYRKYLQTIHTIERESTCFPGFYSLSNLEGYLWKKCQLKLIKEGE